MVEYDWLTDDDERRFFASVVHGLRSQGWAHYEAEAEALERLMRLRDKRKAA